MKRLTFLLVISFASNTAAVAGTVKIHGYVTNVVSPTVFEIEDYRITRDRSLRFELEKGEINEPAEFSPEDIRVGTELEVKGTHNRRTGELRARSIKVFLEEHKKIKRTALMEHPPRLERTAAGWEGTFFADGQRIQVRSSTSVVFKPNKSEREDAKERGKAGRRALQRRESRSWREASSLGGPEQDGRPLESLNEIGLNTFMTYEGYRQPDGSVAAARVELMRNELEEQEAELWERLSPRLRAG
ncbi:MAG: hypothetical protein HY647_08685, partial [Acidobacteria bacterium]|nr:hypothetical protein [Acidobacteriota bacterium]